MHTHFNGRFRIHYNSDLSGDLMIAKVTENGCEEMEIPASVILEFIAICYVLPQRINKLEQATVDELLGVQK